MRVIVCMPATSNYGVCFGGQFWKLITNRWLTQHLYSNWGLVHWLTCPALSTSVRYMLNFSDWILWHKFMVGILDLSIDMQDTWSLLDCARNELGSVRTFLVSRFTVFFMWLSCVDHSQIPLGENRLYYDMISGWKESLTTVWMMLLFPCAWSSIGLNMAWRGMIFLSPRG
jgi:hypothetical protein